MLSTLALLGLHRVIQLLAEAVKLVLPLGGYFLERRAPADAFEMAKESITTESLVVTALVVAVGIPLLYWLRDLSPRT